MQRPRFSQKRPKIEIAPGLRFRKQLPQPFLQSPIIFIEQFPCKSRTLTDLKRRGFLPSRNHFVSQTVPVKSGTRSEEHTSELQSRGHLVCRLLLEKKNKKAHA